MFRCLKHRPAWVLTWYSLVTSAVYLGARGFGALGISEQITLLLLAGLVPVLMDIGYVYIYDFPLHQSRFQYQVVDTNLSHKLGELCSVVGCNFCPSVRRVFGRPVGGVHIPYALRRLQVLIDDTFLRDLGEGEEDVILAHIAAHLKVHSLRAVVRLYFAWLAEFLSVSAGARFLLWLIRPTDELAMLGSIILVAGSSVAAGLTYSSALDDFARRSEMQADVLAAEVVGRERYIALLNKVSKSRNNGGTGCAEPALRLWLLTNSDFGDSASKLREDQ